MTTETPKVRRATVLLGAASAALVAGLVLVAVAALTGGSDAAYGALVGTLIVLGVFGTGSFAVDLVAGMLPAASLLVALLTYTLQVVVMGLVFVALSGSGLLDDTIDRAWLGGTVIVGTFAWLLSQVVLTMRMRIPAFDLPAPTGEDTGPGPRPLGQGGER
jgi:ATP synthase protein I